MMLNKKVALLLNRALRGEPVKINEVPSNGEIPDQERDLLISVLESENPMATYKSLIIKWSNSEAIDAQVFQAGRGDWELGDRKESHLKRNDYIAALNSLGYFFRLNETTDRVEVNGEPITDVVESKIKSDMRDIGLRHVNVARDHFIAHASESSYHPVRQYLEVLDWDGEDHIEHLASFFTDKHDVISFVLRRFLIGAVEKALTGERNRMMVLDGAQYIGKSYFVRWLVPEQMREDHYVESPINPEIKDHRIRLASTWIWEVAELGSTTRRADREALKHFLSMRQVTVRVPYAHYDINKPALSSFVGTINNEAGFLNDPTGHTRYMTVHLRDIDWDYAKEINIDQVWAQAYQSYLDGETGELEGEELEIVNRINEGYEIADPLTDLIQTQFEIDPDRVDWWMSSNEIRDILKQHDWSLRTPRGESMAISSELSRLGIESKRGDDPDTGAQVRGYVGIKRREEKVPW